MSLYYRFVDAVLRWLCQPRNANRTDRVVALWAFTMGLMCVQLVMSVVF